MFLDVNHIQKNTDFLPVISGEKRLQEPHYRQAWKNFREQISLSDVDFDQYYTATLNSFANYVQNLPASRYIFYGHAGGFLQLGFERAIIATQLAIKSYHDFEGLTYDQLDVLAQTEVFAVFTAALLADLNFLPKRFQIKTKNAAEQIKIYDAYEGSMMQQSKFYQYDFLNPELPGWGAPASLTLAQRLLATTQKNYADSAFAWIAQHYSVLQIWYAMILGLTPADEHSTRQKYLIHLIPDIENDMLRELLLNIHRQDWLENKQNTTLFISTTLEEEISQNVLIEELDPMVHDPIYRSRHEFEKVFGGMGAADATNAQIAGSLSSQFTPQLRYGLAFLAWALNYFARERAAGATHQMPRVFRLGDNVVFDVQNLLKDFARENAQRNRTSALSGTSASEIFNILREAQVLKDQHISLLNYTWDTLGGKHHLVGLAVPAKMVVGPLPPITLGLSVDTKAVVSTAQATPSISSMFLRNKPQLG